MTNPSNAIGTNGAYGGRTSVNALNDVLAAFTGRGIVSGWGCVPSSGLTVALGGDGLTRDVALAEDNAGNKTTINNISQSPVSITLAAAPATNSRVDAIVAYVDNPPAVSATALDNPGTVGLIAVSGVESASPTAPIESDIRAAITADGASGATAYYVILAYVLISSGTTDIDATMITAGEKTYTEIGDGRVTPDNIDFTTVDHIELTADGRTQVYYSNGILVAYARWEDTVDITATWGSLYIGTISGTHTFVAIGTQDFIESPKVFIDAKATSSGQFFMVSGANATPEFPTGTNARWRLPANSIVLARPNSRAATPYALDIMAIGRWK